jgi:hypothetical protein
MGGRSAAGSDTRGALKAGVSGRPVMIRNCRASPTATAAIVAQGAATPAVARMPVRVYGTVGVRNAGPVREPLEHRAAAGGGDDVALAFVQSDRVSDHRGGRPALSSTAPRSTSASPRCQLSSERRESRTASRAAASAGSDSPRARAREWRAVLPATRCRPPRGGHRGGVDRRGWWRESRAHAGGDDGWVLDGAGWRDRCGSRYFPSGPEHAERPALGPCR